MAEAADEVARSAWLRKSMQGWLVSQATWPTNLEEYALAHFFILSFFVLLTSLADYGVHHVQRRLQPPEEERPRMKNNRPDLRRQIALIVWTRLQGELMVVGSLVVWIWLMHETGLLDGIAAFSVRWQKEHPSVDANPVSEPFSDPTAWLGWALSCHPRTPRDPTTLLHVLQDVLVAFFVAKVLYFLFLLLTLRTQTDWLETYERLESGGAPRNPAEHFSWRQIDAMREQLLQILRSDPTLKAQVGRSADLTASVDSGSLYVSGFLAEMVHAHMELLAQFSPRTWMLIFFYVATTAFSLFMCIGYNHLTFALDLLWYAASVYLAYRLLLHAATLRQTARELEAERHRTHRPSGRPARSGWPLPWVDWLLFPFVGPGVTGFVPFARKPSELVGIRCLQAMLWVHFYRLGEYATDPFRRHASINAMAIELVVDLLPKILFLLLWALWIVPGMLEVFSLPPFLDDLEHSLLLHTLRAYPRGLPADGLLIEPEDRPSASADGGRVPRPVSFSSGMEYVVLKAQRRAAVDSKWTDWRAMRSTWRGLIGLPPLRDPGRRLADHYGWIHTELAGDAGPPTPASGGQAQAVGLPATPVLSAGHLGLMSANRGATPDHGASPTCDQAAMSSAMSLL